MRMKDRLFVAISQGQLDRLSDAREYIREHNINIGLKMLGRQVMIKVDSDGWMTPKEWKFNYWTKL